MGERPDDVRRDPLVNSVDGPEVVRSQIGPDPALGGGVGGGAVVDEAEVERVEIERTRAEIERTRADMGETVDAIQQRLSPENLKDQAKDRVKEATVGKAQGVGSAIVESVRANPVPAALTGISLGWLVMSARRQSSAQLRYEERDPNGLSTGQAVERARDKVGETASQAQDKAGQVAGQAQHQVSRLGDQAQYQTRRAGDEFQRVLRENPLTVGALAVGVGAAIGLAVPQTSREHEVMGEARDSFVEKAQEKAEEAQQKVQQVAEEAQSAAKEEAENQGLTQE
jgi:ElaB/YqjD/DUF883 family membrane-anchored ribosome-binding protein